MSQAGIATIGEDPGIFKWDEILVGGPTFLINGHGAIANTTAPTLCQLTLPAASDVGEIVAVCGKGTGLYQIQQNAGQQIHYGNVSTTVGVGGSVTSTQRRDTIELLCTTANTEWTVLDSVGIHNVS